MKADKKEDGVVFIIIDFVKLVYRLLAFRIPVVFTIGLILAVLKFIPKSIYGLTPFQLIAWVGDSGFNYVRLVLSNVGLG